MQVILTSTALKYSHPKRLNVLKQWIQYLSRVRGIDQWTLYVGVEKDCEEDINIYKNNIKFMPIKYVHNIGPKGPHANHISVWNRAFNDGGEFFIFLEDDVLAGPDLCEYMNELGNKYYNVPEIFCINSYTGNEDENKKFAVWRKPSLGVWGFGMWRDRASECLQDYAKSGIGYVSQIGWDVHLNQISRRQRDCIMPCYSRCLNIGMDGIHFNKYEPELNINNRTWTGDDPDMINYHHLPYYEIAPLTKQDYVRATVWI